MKKTFQYRKLGDLCEVIAGQSPEGKFYNTEGKGMPFYQGKKDFCDKFIGEPSMWTTQITKIARRGDILMSIRAPVGPINYAKNESCIGRGLASIRVKSELNPDFLFYQLLYMQPQISGREGAVFPSINKSEIESLAIYFTSLAEQKRIVEFLNESFEGIAHTKASTEKNLKSAREIFESHLNAIYSQRGEGWVNKSLGDVCNLLNGFAFKSGDSVPHSETQLVRMGNLYGNNLNLSRSPVFYPNNFATVYQNYLLKEGDIIMSLTGTTGKEDYGYAVKIPECPIKLLMNQRIVKFDSIKQNINSDYLFYYLRSRTFLDILYRTANGTRQANLSSVILKTLPIPLCSISQQKKFASSFEEIARKTQSLESIYQRKLIALAELKKSLLQQAFTGKLKVSP